MFGTRLRHCGKASAGIALSLARLGVTPSFDTRAPASCTSPLSIGRSFFWLASIGVLSWNWGAMWLHAEDAGIVDLNEVKRRVSEWRSSFVNVHAVWELRSLPDTDQPILEQWPPPPEPATAKLFSREEWIWADHGLDLFEDWTFFYDDGSSQFHRIDAFNGPKGLVFRANFQRPKQGEPEKFTDLHLLGLGVGKPISKMARVALDGVYWSATARWLPEKLSQDQWELEGVENVNGERCARLMGAAKDDPDVIDILWLDLNYDCLVRRHRIPPVQGRMIGSDFIVDEFQQLEPGIWFPKRGRLQLGATPHQNQLFVVVEAAVNQSLDLARFEPPPPNIGTAVADHGRTYVHGGATAPPGTGPQPSTPTELAGIPHTSGAPSASPPASPWIWSCAALISASVLFLSLGIRLSRHKQEGASGQG